MQVRSISEADPLQRWEIDFPSYRVHFYDRFGTGASGGTCICFLLTDVHNVHQGLRLGRGQCSRSDVLRVRRSRTPRRRAGLAPAVRR
jgi:hypothetical protein